MAEFLANNAFLRLLSSIRVGVFNDAYIVVNDELFDLGCN